MILLLYYLNSAFLSLSLLVPRSKSNYLFLKEPLALGLNSPISILEQLKAGEHFETGLSRYSHGLKALESMAQPVFGKHFNIDRLLTLCHNEVVAHQDLCPICERGHSPYRPAQAAHFSIARTSMTMDIKLTIIVRTHLLRSMPFKSCERNQSW